MEDAQEQGGRNNRILPVMNLMSTIIGAGLLSLPATIKVVGLLDILSIILVGFLTYYTSSAILKARNSNSYAGVVNDTLGIFYTGSLHLCFVLNIVVMLIGNMIVIGNVLCGTSANGVMHVGVLARYIGEQWGMEYKALLVTRVAFFASLASFILESWWITSVLRGGLALISLVFTLVFSISKLVRVTPLIPGFIFNFTDISRCFFTVATTYIYQFDVRALRNENPIFMGQAVLISWFLCLFAYILGSFSGIFLFDVSTVDNVVVNFDSASNFFVRIFYALHFIVVFSNNFHVLHLSLDGLMALIPDARVYDHLRNRGFAIATIAISGIISIGTNFAHIAIMGTIFKYIGVVTTVAIGLIYPPLILWNVHRAQRVAVYQSVVTWFRNGWAWITNEYNWIRNLLRWLWQIPHLPSNPLLHGHIN